jgi:hypothetical protein
LISTEKELAEDNCEKQKERVDKIILSWISSARGQPAEGQKI